MDALGFKEGRCSGAAAWQEELGSYKGDFSQAHGSFLFCLSPRHYVTGAVLDEPKVNVTTNSYTPAIEAVSSKRPLKVSSWIRWKLQRKLVEPSEPLKDV